jgi:hypothetical protein
MVNYQTKQFKNDHIELFVITEGVTITFGLALPPGIKHQDIVSEALRCHL